jgi:hypothetical protein
MTNRWRTILPLIGLLLFAAESWDSFKMNRHPDFHSRRFYWWSSIRLDSHRAIPQSTPSITRNPDGTETVGWDPEYLIVSPGYLARLAMLTSFPAFLVGIPLIKVAGRFGANEVWVFFGTMPLLLVAWFYLCGWFLDRRRARKYQLRLDHGRLAT